MKNTQNKQPLVSIVMSVYNAEEYVQGAITSLLEQTYKEIEIICINDGSTDATMSLISHIEDPRFTCINDGENKGLATRLNEGFAVAKGVYIARMDADDIALSSRIEEQVRFMENNNIDVCGTGFEIIPSGKKIYMPKSHKEIVAKNLFTPGFAHPTVMFRTAFWKKHNCAYPLLPCAQDYALWVQLQAKATFANIPKILLEYRVHGKSTTHRLQHQKESILQQIQQPMLTNILGKAPIAEEQALHASISLGLRNVKQFGYNKLCKYVFQLMFRAKGVAAKKEVILKALAYILRK